MNIIKSIILFHFQLIPIFCFLEVQNNTNSICSEYVECLSVSVLEERLCLGNSKWRPYWLSKLNDPNKCHEKLKNDYILLDRLEEELDTQLKACLMESSTLSETNKRQCEELSGKFPKFSFGRSITYVPSHCFTGVKRRIERQCGIVDNCCPGRARCQLLNSQSTLQKLLNTTRQNMWKRASDCEKGLNVEQLILENFSFSIDSDNEHLGHVNVKFTDVESQLNKNKGFININFSTANNEEKPAIHLTTDDESSPKLSFVNKNNLTDFDKKYEEALKNTNEYKKKIMENEINTGIGSLIDAATVSESTFTAPPMGTVTPSETPIEPLIISNSEDHESTVTSSPIIFLEEQDSKNEATIKTCKPASLQRLQNVLEMLGESGSSEDMQSIVKLVNQFQQKLRGKNLSTQQMNHLKSIEKSFEKLAQHFEIDNYHLVEKELDNMLDGNENWETCENKEEPSGNGTVMEVLVDDNGDQLVIENGTSSILKFNVDDSRTTYSSKDEDMQDFISDSYKKEIEEYRKEHQRFSENNSTEFSRNETSCDMYMRCRNQMHLAVDSCAWRYASDQLLSSMAESAESLLYKEDGFHAPDTSEKYSNLYELMINRNNKLRGCLDSENEKYFNESICLAYDEEHHHIYENSLKRLLNSSHQYEKSNDCFTDANLIQQKCSKLRDCCPNFDKCRESTFDESTERAIINLTALLNDAKQLYIKNKAKQAVKNAIRQLILNTPAGQMLSKFEGDISRGARVVRMAKYR